MRNKNLNYARNHLLAFMVYFSLVLIPVNGDLLPEKPYVFIHQQLELTCIAEFNNSSSSDFYFTKGDNKISADHVTIISNTTALLNQTIHGVDGAGRYGCWRGLDLIGTQIVKVEYAPRKVENLTCVVYDWTEGMTCTWNLGVKYVRPRDVSVQLFYTTMGRKYMVCPKLTETSCTWNDQNFFGASSYYIVVVINNTVKAMDVQPKYTTLSLVTLDRVKPSPVYSIEFINSKTCVKLNWKHQTARPKIYRVLYMTRNKTLVSTNFTSGENAKIEICHLSPYTEYKFSIDCKPEHKGYWSDAKVISVRTQPDFPLSGPQVAIGSFEVFNCNDENERSVNIFWGDVLDDEQRGEITAYILIHNNSNYTLSGNVHRYRLSYMKCSEEQVIHIFSVNIAGYSLNYSSIIIPNKQTEKPGVYNFTVELESRDNATFTMARWKPIEKNTTYTVFWCLIDKDPLCKSGISWVHSSAYGNEVKLPLTKNNWLSMHYGIAVDKYGVSGGIQWTRCRIRKDAKLKEPPKNVLAKEKVGALEVQWRYEQCPQDSQAFIQFYVIGVCDSANCNSNKLFIRDTNKGNSVVSYHADKIDGSKRDYIYQNPIQEVNYSIYVVPYTATGPGPQSSSIFFVVKPDDESLKYKLIAGIGIVIILGVAALLIWFCYGLKKEPPLVVSSIQDEITKYDTAFKYTQHLHSPSHQVLINPQLLDMPAHEDITLTDRDEMTLITTNLHSHFIKNEKGKEEKTGMISDESRNPTTKEQSLNNPHSTLENPCMLESIIVNIASETGGNYGEVNPDYIPFQQYQAPIVEMPVSNDVCGSSTHSDIADKSNKLRSRNSYCIHSDYVDNTLMCISNLTSQDNLVQLPNEDSEICNVAPADRNTARTESNLQLKDTNEQTPTLQLLSDIKTREIHGDNNVSLQSGRDKKESVMSPSIEMNLMPTDKTEGLNYSELVHDDIHGAVLPIASPKQEENVAKKHLKEITPLENGYFRKVKIFSDIHWKFLNKNDCDKKSTISNEQGLEKALNFDTKELSKMREAPSMYINGVTTDEICDNILIENPACNGDKKQKLNENEYANDQENRNVIMVPSVIDESYKKSKDIWDLENDTSTLSHSDSFESSSGSRDAINLSTDALSYVKVDVWKPSPIEINQTDGCTGVKFESYSCSSSPSVVKDFGTHSNPHELVHQSNTQIELNMSRHEC